MSRVLLIFWGIIVLSETKAQILTGPIVGGQATVAGYGSQYDGVDFQQDLSFNYLGGWSYAYEISDHLAFYSELVYSRKGKVQRYNSTSTRIVENQTYSHFLDAPILLRITGPIGRSKARWFINAGPQISYWLGGRGTVTAYEFFGSDQLTQIDYTVRFSEDEPAEGVLAVDGANRLQFSLAAGGGFSIPVNRSGHEVVINLRYVSGTTFMGGNESFEIGTTEIEEYLGYKHNALQVLTAYVIPIDIFGMRRGKSSRKVKHKK
ncbi:outer membrane beta-barrel protein [Tunicatimonas pelagia]|uniref:outer membrane beta-barrel protein n=1 Tax=Tunicatimonas pelagia TaxID=931531 RepID=UPI0026669EB7|nr:outer membrane beta-barrel protein [Tunicatimonas pelagia]WKN43839.1 outer membrane beta-barrel protein [Tunicatimonas pelagia]